mgnify:CR=1 FL=1
MGKKVKVVEVSFIAFFAILISDRFQRLNCLIRKDKVKTRFLTKL